MLPISITKKFEFDASHKLPDEQIFGKCANLHGHTYKLEVEVGADQLHHCMIMNFTNLKKIVQKSVLDKYDHQYLNQFWKFPTAENMIITIAKDIEAEIANFENENPGVPTYKLVSVVLYETSNSYVKWTNPKKAS